MKPPDHDQPPCAGSSGASRIGIDEESNRGALKKPVSTSTWSRGLVARAPTVQNYGRSAQTAASKRYRYVRGTRDRRGRKGIVRASHGCCTCHDLGLRRRQALHVV